MLGLDTLGLAPTLNDWHERVHSDDRLKLDCAIQTAIQNPARGDFELKLRVCHRDGRELWILDKGTVIERAVDGSALRVAGTHLDITDRMQAQQALRESENFNAAVIDSLTKEIAVLDARGVIIAVNEAWMRFGANNGAGGALESIGLGVDYLGAFAEAVDGLQNRYVDETRIGIRGVLGRRRAARVSLGLPLSLPHRAAVVPDECRPDEGRSRGAVVSHINITQRKLADVALRDSEQRYRRLFDSNPQPMWVYDVETLAFLAVNSAAVAQYGYGRDEFLSMSMRWRPPRRSVVAALDVLQCGLGLCFLLLRCS